MADLPPTGGHLELPGIDHLEVVGRGGFAAVYRGWQPAFNRWVAVKFLTGAHGQSPAYRFDQEARAIGSLSQHPHVVPVYDAGEIDGRPYLVMPFLTGGSLQHRIQAGPVHPREAVATGQAMAEALSEAHRQGILHRDIKPANILFTGYGVPQLADFGVARLADSTMTGGFLAVTVCYAAPEVLSGQPATPLSDVYSLGATLYAALRGVPPFEGDDGQPAIAQAMRVVQELPPPLEHFGVPGPVAAVVAHAMAKDPAHRYSSAAELRQALAAVYPLAAAAANGVPGAYGHPTGNRPAPAPGTSRPGHRHLLDVVRRPTRRTLMAGAAAVALLAAAGGAAAVATSSSDGSSHTARATAPPGTGASTSGMSPLRGRPAASPLRGRSAASPPTALASGSTAAGDLPPSAGGATTPAAIAPATLADTIRSYYALVDQHRLDQSWAWLAPDFQARIGVAYYHQFWDSISQVQVMSVEVAGAAARVTLRYAATNGATSVEAATLGFAIAGHRIVIDMHHP